MFDRDITKRVNSYVYFSEILKTFIGSVQKNWDNCIAEYQATGNFSLNLTNYEEVFNHASNFLKDNDFYHS